MSESGKLTKLTIRRSKWTKSVLTTSWANEYSTTSHCALGAYMHALGVPNSDMWGNWSPCIVYRYHKNREQFASLLVETGADWLLCRKGDDPREFELSRDAVLVIGINDSTSPDREDRLKEIFARHGVELEFT